MLVISGSAQTIVVITIATAHATLIIVLCLSEGAGVSKRRKWKATRYGSSRVLRMRSLDVFANETQFSPGENFRGAQKVKHCDTLGTTDNLLHSTEAS